VKIDKQFLPAQIFCIGATYKTSFFCTVVPAKMAGITPHITNSPGGAELLDEYF
jgi:hypothetical protein